MDDRQPPAEASGLPVHGAAAPAPAPEPAEPPALFAPLRLLLLPGGPCVELSRPDTLIGRHSDADVRLALPDVSRRHCRLVYAHNCWQVFDLNSLNGIFVNGNRVQQATLDQGDRLRIGGLVFEVRLGEPDATEELEPGPGVLRSIVDALPRPGRGSDHPQRKAS
jgi:hypothetical protein